MLFFKVHWDTPFYSQRVYNYLVIFVEFHEIHTTESGNILILSSSGQLKIQPLSISLKLYGQDHITVRYICTSQWKTFKHRNHEGRRSSQTAASRHLSIDVVNLNPRLSIRHLSINDCRASLQIKSPLSSGAASPTGKLQCLHLVHGVKTTSVRFDSQCGHVHKVTQWH